MTVSHITGALSTTGFRFFMTEFQYRFHHKDELSSL